MADPRVEIIIDQGAVQAMLGRTSDRACRRAAERTRDRAKRNLVTAGRVNTGNLLNSIAVFARGDGEYGVGSRVFYAKFQEEGIGPVVPVRAKVLRFKPKGAAGFIFRPRSKGFRGAFYMKRAAEALTVQDFLP